MKIVTVVLRTFLHTQKNVFMCDLYELKLLSGLTFYYADYDMDIVFGGKTYSHKGPVFERDKIEVSSKITVDKMNIDISVDETDTIGGSPTMHVAHNGGLDDATLSLLYCYMSAPGVVVGTLEQFTGDIDINDGGGLGMQWEVKSSVQRLNVEWPLHKYYPTCPYTLYDAGCGLNLADYMTTGTVTAVTSQQEFTTNINLADGYFNQGGIEWLSGPLSGADAPIKNSYADGVMVMLIPLESVPVVGNTFRVYPGCEKTPAICTSKFNNFLRNRATPYIPLKETIV